MTMKENVLNKESKEINLISPFENQELQLENQKDIEDIDKDFDWDWIFDKEWSRIKK